MPYLMGGFPDVERFVAVGVAYADGRRGSRGAGRPVLRPAGRRPGHPRRRHRARWPRARPCTASSRRARRSPSASRSCSCATPTRCWRAVRSASAASCAARGISGLIVPDLPLEEADADPAPPVTPPGSRSSRSSRRPRRTTGWARSARSARGFIYTVSRGRHHGRARRRPAGLAGLLGRVKAHSPVPVALGFGISTAAQAAAAADAGRGRGDRRHAARAGGGRGVRRGARSRRGGGRARGGTGRRPGPIAFAGAWACSSPLIAGLVHLDRRLGRRHQVVRRLPGHDRAGAARRRGPPSAPLPARRAPASRALTRRTARCATVELPLNGRLGCCTPEPGARRIAARTRAS